MTKTLHATFDGKVLCPEEPMELWPNTRIKLIFEETAPLTTIKITKTNKCSFLRTAQSLRLQGPSDWSAHLTADEHFQQAGFRALLQEELNET